MPKPHMQVIVFVTLVKNICEPIYSLRIRDVFHVDLTFVLLRSFRKHVKELVHNNPLQQI